MTPADKLREAARQVRELAGKATPGPWAYQGAFGTGFVYPADAPPEQTVAQAWIVRAREHNARFADARWIAALSPDVAEPLAAWLDAAADQAESLYGSLPDSLRTAATENAHALPLALADALGVGGKT